MMTQNGQVRGWTRGCVLGLALISTTLLSACAGNATKANTQNTQNTTTHEAMAAESGPESGQESGQNMGPNADLLRYAESGDVGAQYDLGLTLAASDPKAAAGWLERAALQGYGQAAYTLGRIQTDPKRAIEWHSMASAMGHVGAQYELGDAYFNGRGTAREPGWGLMWFERAARAGYADAQYAMGAALAGGALGAAQPDKALVWLLIAQANHRADLDGEIDALKARLTPEALAVAELRAAVWTNEPVSDVAGDRATLRFAQYALNRLGFEAGPVDGIAGERTEVAIAAFRATDGLGGGGLDGRMLDRLRERLALLNR